LKYNKKSLNKKKQNNGSNLKQKTKCMDEMIWTQSEYLSADENIYISKLNDYIISQINI